MLSWLTDKTMERHNHDDRPNMLQFTSLDDIDMAYVKESKSQMRETLINKLTTTLSNPACVDASFNNDCQENGECHFDFQRAKQFFDDLKDLPEKDAITTAVKDLVSKLSVKHIHRGPCRLYIILPLCHVLNSKENYLKVTYHFGHSLWTLKENLKGNLDEWLKTIERPFFQRILKMYRNGLAYLGDLIETNDAEEIKRRKKCLHHFTFIMHRLHKVNRSRSLQVGYRKFQVRQLMKHVNIEEDFTAGQIQKCFGNENFYFDHMFLYDVISKHTLLKYQNAIQMQSATFHAKDFLTLKVTRKRLLEDAKEQLQNLSKENLAKRLQVSFQDEEGLGSGVNRNFFQLVFKEFLKESTGLFSCGAESRCLWFSDQAKQDSLTQEKFHLLGKLCGLAIYNDIEIDFSLPIAFFKKMLNIPLNSRDLEELNPAYSRSEFLDQEIDQLNKSVQKPFENFKEGFRSVPVGRIWTCFFHHELMALMHGSQDYDFNILERNTTYEPEYTADHPTIRLFWQALHQFSLEEKKNFISFFRGTHALPLAGMQEVNMKIRPNTKGGDREQDYLPETSTCFGELYLPRYTSLDNLEERLSLSMCETTFQSL